MYLTMNERHSVIERLLSLFMGQYDSFSKTQKINAKNRKPFYDFLSWCAVLYSGGYSVFM